MADRYQCRGVIRVLVICCCCCFCNAGSANDSDLIYKIQKWTQRISGELLSTTIECDVCGHQCSWRYDHNTISNSSEVTLYADSNDYGEYICYQASQVVMKVLVIPGNDNFTCSKCLTSSVCDNGEEVISISFSIHIDIYFITLPECEVLRDGLMPVCTIGSGKCSGVFTSYNRSADYTIHCPIVDTSYIVRSGKINLNGDLQPCTTEITSSHHSMVTPATVSLPVSSITASLVPSQTTIDLEVVPSNTASTDKENAPSTAGAIAGAVLGVVLLLLSVLFGVIVCYHFRRQPNHRGGNDSISVQNAPEVQCSDKLPFAIPCTVPSSSDTHNMINPIPNIPTATDYTDGNGLTDVPTEDNEIDQSLTVASSNKNVPVFVVYNNDSSMDDVQDFSELLISNGVDMDTDLYHTDDNPDDWSLWVEKQLKCCIDNNGLIILLWSHGLAAPLQDETQNHRIQMSYGHIFRASLRNLIQEHLNRFVLVSFVPVSVQDLPPYFKDRTIFTIPIAKIPTGTSPRNILNHAEFTQLKDLVVTIARRTELQ